MKKLLYEQLIPLSLSVVTAFCLMGLLWLEVLILNRFISDPIIMRVRFPDVLIGAVIYLKTSIDFAIYIAELMSANRGWRSRIAIEIGTALGNAIGTFLIIIIWVTFKEVTWLLALMILIAALVLFRLAEDSFERLYKQYGERKSFFANLGQKINIPLRKINSVFNPVLKYIIPDLSVGNIKTRTFKALFLFSIAVPFILGLDDFAGYIPIFSVVNVLGFAVGVFLGHMILNIFLYISPSSTIKVVENQFIAFFGSLVFIGLGLWGIFEVVQIFSVHL